MKWSHPVSTSVDIEEVRALIAEELELPAEEVTDDADLKKDLEVDSLTAMEIAVQLEKKYRIKIGEQELVALTSLRSTHQLVSAKVATT
jgi:acyl carrier protein